MDWIKLIGDSVKYIEEHITDDITVDGVAASVCISSYYFQKGFSMLCGFSVAEYIRNRRLALAGNEIVAGNGKIIDIALKYGYDSPDSFTKAFTRFHGVTPLSARKDGAVLKSFAPLKIKFSLEGGYIMDYKIEKKEAFKVIGDRRTFDYETAKTVVPKFWQEHFASGKGKTVCGEFGINIDLKMGHDSFEYLIADRYSGGEVPEGFEVREIPSFMWAVFPCRGPMPTALQDVNTKIFTEWLPSLSEYEFAAGYCVEMYDDPTKYPKGTSDGNYYCEIWIPVKKKQ